LEDHPVFSNLAVAANLSIQVVLTTNEGSLDALARSSLTVIRPSSKTPQLHLIRKTHTAAAFCMDWLFTEDACKTNTSRVTNHVGPQTV